MNHSGVLVDEPARTQRTPLRTAQQGGAEAVAAQRRVHHALEARRLGRANPQQHEDGRIAFADEARAGGEIGILLDRAGELDPAPAAILSRSTPRLVWLF